MFKTGALNNVANAYVDKDVPGAIPGTRIEADDQNIKQQEIINAVIESGQTLDAPGTFTNNMQISKAIQQATRGYIDGLIVSPGTDTDHEVDISDGACSLKNGAGLYRSLLCLNNPTKQINVDWAEGNDAGGFPSGLTLGNDTHYYVIIIAKWVGEVLTIDAGYDTDIDASNLLADATDYTWYRPIRSIFTNGSANIRGTWQIGDNVFYDTAILDVNDPTITSDVYETGTFHIPPNTLGRFVFEGSGELSGAGIKSRNMFKKLKSIDGTKIITFNTTPVSDFATQDMVFGNNAQHDVDSNSQMKYTVEFADLTNVGVVIRSYGWIDNRGKNA